MSNQVSVLVYGRRVGSPVRKAVLVYFAERASDNGEGVWASKPTIAAAIECGRSTVIRAINEFVAEGILREVGKRPCRGGATTEYAMNLDAIAALPAVDEVAPDDVTSPAAGPVPERDPSQSGTLPVPQRDPNPSRSGTQTTIGTIIEPSVESAARASDDAKPPAKSRLPDGWVLDDDGWKYARSLQLTDREIEEIADDFREYWKERRDADSRKSESGWRRTWKNRCRDIAPQYRRNRPMAGQSFSGGRGQGSSIASIVARRRLAGQD